MVRRAKFDLMICRGGVALLFFGSVAVLSCNPTERASPTTSPEPVIQKATVVRPSECQALTDLAAGTGPLKLCNRTPSAKDQQCPAPDDIVVLIDNDDLTAARRMGRDVPATNWQNLLLDVEAIGRTECAGGGRPLERLPGRCGTIQDAVGTLRTTACRGRGGLLFPRFLTSGSGSTTSATEAVQSIVRTMTGPGRPPGIVFVAFDGVVDGDYRNAAARLAFADAVSDAAAVGLKVWIIASPADYRYIYVFARAPFEEFADKATNALGSTLQAGSGSSVVTVSLSETRYLRASAVADVAHIAVGRASLPGAEWSFNNLALKRRVHSTETVGEMWKADLRRWLGATVPAGDAQGAILRASWDADASHWDALVPFGVRFPPPAVLLNRPVHLAGAAGSNAAWVQAPAIDVRMLEGCASRRAAAPVAQGVSIAPGQADFLVIRGATSRASWLNQPITWWPDNSSSLKSDLVASAGPPFMAAALVTQPPRPSRCTEALLREFAGSHAWGSGRTTPELTTAVREPDCQPQQWSKLIDGLKSVKYRRFHPGAVTPWSPTDSRVAVETFLTVVETAARRLVQQRSASDNGSCVLATLQFESGTAASADPTWVQEPLK